LSLFFLRYTERGLMEEGIHSGVVGEGQRAETPKEANPEEMVNNSEVTDPPAM